MLEEFARLYHVQFKKEFPCRKHRIKSVWWYFFADVYSSFCSCLAHVMNLGTQVLISTYSKAPHYTPHSPQAHEPHSTQHGDHDEIGLVRAICVKVCLHFFFKLGFTEYNQRNAHLQNERNFIRQFKSRLLYHPLCSSSSIWRFSGHQLMSW